MKLITHIMLTLNIPKDVTKGFALKIQALKSVLKMMHRVLLKFEVEEGELIYPEDRRKLPISNVDTINKIKSKTTDSIFFKLTATIKPIEPDGNGLHKVSSKNLKKSFQLYSFDMIPQYLQSNPYIQTGYRHDLTVKGCLISLFYLNNESVNIWSHLIGAGLFMYFLIRDIYNGKALQILASLTDCSFALFYILSVITCMLCSAVFHLFNCTSSRAFNNLLKLDLFGIVLGILGVYLCGLHLSFECYRHWRIRYETMIMGIMFIAVIYYVQGVKRYITRNIHVSLFLIISITGILPGVHWYYLHGGWSNQIVQHFFPKLFKLYGILAVGVLAYLTKFPERLFPGYFDLVLASHQIWHLASLAAFVYWYQNGVELLQFRLMNPCNTQVE